MLQGANHNWDGHLFSSNTLSHSMQAALAQFECQRTSSSVLWPHFPEVILETSNNEERHNKKKPCTHQYLASWGCRPWECSTGKENSVLLPLSSPRTLSYNTPREFLGFSSVNSQLASCRLAETSATSQQKAQSASNTDQPHFLQVPRSVQYRAGFQNFTAEILIIKWHNLLREIVSEGPETIHHDSCIK